MKKLCFLLAVPLLLLSTFAMAQPGTPKSDAQNAFEKLKTLAGNWEARVKTDPVADDVEGKPMQATLRVTSMGNALLHEMSISGRPDDPITMFYLDSDKLTLTHYCDAGNRPRMVATTSPDGKTVKFDLVDVSGSMKYGHMHGAAFTFIDADHHVEEWTFMQGEKPVHARFEMARKKDRAPEGK